MEKSTAILWKNVLALMEHRWDGENLNRLAREAKIGAATASRIKDQKTATRITTLDKLAVAFKLKPWQLLVPDLQPAALPAAVARQPTPEDIKKVEQLTRAAVELTPTQRELLINSPVLKALLEPKASPAPAKRE